MYACYRNEITTPRLNNTLIYEKYLSQCSHSKQFSAKLHCGHNCYNFHVRFYRIALLQRSVFVVIF